MDKPRLISAPVMLKGQNYLLWSRTMKTTLCSHGLWNHVNTAQILPLAIEGEEVAAAEQKEMDRWFQEDQLVLSIIQNSLESSLLDAYSYCETAKSLWETLQKVYGNSSNLMRIYEVKKALFQQQQQDMEFTKHFGKYRALWAELEMLRPKTIDPTTLDERHEQDKVFGLFMTLNSSYTDLIKHMLRDDKLPSLEDVCAKIQREQGSHELFGHKDEIITAHKGFYKPEEKKKMICEHCKRTGHSKKDCWILHPELKPSWFITKPRSKSTLGVTHVQAQASTSSCNPALAPSSSQTVATASPSLASHSEFVKRSDLEAIIKSLTSGNVMGKSLHASFQISNDVKPLIVDSGASHHMISDLSLIENLEPALGNVLIANGTKVPIKGIGNLKLFDKKSKAFYMPTFTSNLLSVKRATTDLNALAIFGPNEFHFQDIETSKVLGKGTTRNDLYVLEDLSSSKSCVASIDSSIKADLWHARLGHPHTRALELILPSMKFQNEMCEACILGKHCKTVFEKSTHTYEHCFDLVHSDVWTSPYSSRENYKYFVTFIDEKSKYTWVTLLSSKDRVLEAFINFHTYVTNQYNAKIKCFRSDNGGEYTAHKFQQHLSKHGITHQTSCPYTPQQNGVAERKNRHLMEVVRSMMFHMKVPKRFWADAVMAACYLINRIPTKVLDDMSPFEVLNQTKPSLEHLRVFGCVCFVLVPGELRNKLEPKSTKAMFIGYSTTQKGYKCYNPETRRVLVSRDVRFMESKGFYEEGTWDQFKDISSTTSDQAANLRNILEGLGITSSHNNTSQPNELPRPTPVFAPSRPTPVLAPPRPTPVVAPQTVISSPPVPPASSSSAPAVTPLTPKRPHGVDHEGGESSTHDHHDSEEDEPRLVSASKRQRDQPTLIQALEEEEDITQEEPIALRRSTRQRFPPEHWKNTRVYYNHNAVVHHDQGVCHFTYIPADHVAFTLSLDKEQIPKNYEEAMTIKEWRDAVQAERQAMEKNRTYDQAKLPKGKKAVSSKWIFTIKYKSNGEIDRYKARLVARGFTQTYGEDYSDTFAPVAKLHSVNVLLSLATNLDWELWQMDVKNAFLQGELEEEVYMTPPPGLEDQVDSGNVLRLRKAIYGLKQSPRAWYHKLNVTLRDRGFRRSHVEHTLFTLQGKDGIVVILIYVDDIIISGNDKVGIASTKDYLKSVFDIKDLGELKYFLGIEVCRFKEGLFLSQRKYALDLLTLTGMLEAKSAKTPLEEGYKIEPEGEQESGDFQDAKLYRKVVGKLIYLTITRPDLCFAVNQVSQHMQNPKLRHWELIDRILRYLKGTHDQGIWMGKNGNTDVVGYCDADWAGDRNDRRSTTGYCTLIGGNLVTWKTKKQKVVSCSSAEAEYRAMRRLTTECIWLKQLLLDLGVDIKAPITVHCDNQAAIHIASNSVFHERTKHIEVDCHKVREAIEKGVILPCYTRSVDQLADVFTKATTFKVSESIYPRLGLASLPQHCS